jgi:Protein of unknown function (DUF2950)
MSIVNSLILRVSVATLAAGSPLLGAAPQEGQQAFSSPQVNLAWRIGRNELAAIDVCRAYVEAQMQYASRALCTATFPQASGVHRMLTRDQPFPTGDSSAVGVLRII